MSVPNLINPRLDRRIIRQRHAAPELFVVADPVEAMSFSKRGVRVLVQKVAQLLTLVDPRLPQGPPKTPICRQVRSRPERVSQSRFKLHELAESSCACLPRSGFRGKVRSGTQAHP